MIRLPLGHGIRAEGICLSLNCDDDMIWQAAIEQNMASGAGKLKKSIDRTLAALVAHQLSKERAASLLESGQKKAAPDQTKLAEQIQQKLLPASENLKELPTPPS